MRHKFTHKIIAYLLVFTIAFAMLSHTQTAFAAGLKFYNYNTGKTVNYTGKQVTYFYNNRKVNLSYPGIITDGIALAAYDELFIQELGLKADIKENTIHMTDGITTAIFTVGSKSAKVNGILKDIGVAPVKLKFSDGTEKLYIPTRFVAETFGYDYTWVSSSSTVKITKQFLFSINSETLYYNGIFYPVYYNNRLISTGTLKPFYYHGTIMVPVQEIFEALGCYYAQTEDMFLLNKEDISLSAQLYEKETLVNGMSYRMHITPIEVTNEQTKQSAHFIPLEFAAKVLGFEIAYDSTEKSYTLSETKHTGKKTNPIVQQIISATSQDTASSIKLPEPPSFFTNDYFQWNATKQEMSSSHADCLTTITAYGLDFADVIELHGIRMEHITAFTDGNQLILEIVNTNSALEDQYYSNENNTYLSYVLLSNLTTHIKLSLVLQPEHDWYIKEQEDGVQLYIKNRLFDIENWIAQSDYDTSLQENYSVSLQDNLLVALPEGYTGNIEDHDNYLQHNFQLILSGNHVNFYENHKIQNPYFAVKDYSVTYDAKSRSTVLTFYTRMVCGYQYERIGDCISIRVARPSELYSKIVLLDAGHGGSDPGAQKSGIKEKNLTFTIMNTYVKQSFENSDIKVYFTRESDVLIDLYDRADFASELGADLFISLHMNANNSTSVKGTEVYYSLSNNRKNKTGLSSSQLARSLVNRLCITMNTQNRGVLAADFVVVKYNTVPAVLIELGYMTNKTDLSKLNDSAYQKKAAAAIYESVSEIFETYPTNR